MKTDELDGLSWLATPGSLEALPPSVREGLVLRPTSLQRDALLTACLRPGDERRYFAVDGWLFVFGFQLGLHDVTARELSRAHGVALAFENNHKRDIKLCRLYRNGELVRTVSDIGSEFTQLGPPLPGEPALERVVRSETVAQLARAWGCDVTRLEWGTAGLIAAPRFGRRLRLVAGLLLLLAVAAVALRAVPSSEERCRKRCRASARSTYQHTPECRGAALEACAAFTEAVDFCAATCR